MSPRLRHLAVGGRTRICCRQLTLTESMGLFVSIPGRFNVRPGHSIIHGEKRAVIGEMTRGNEGRKRGG